MNAVASFPAAVSESRDETAVVAPSEQALDFFNFSREEFARFVVDSLAAPAYSATQVFDWVYRKAVLDPRGMSNVRAQLRDELTRRFVFPQARIVQRQVSSDGSRKYLFALSSGSEVESVMIKQPNRMTLCVSSQVGCAMGCTFCRTGEMGFRRNLSTSEILQQVMAVSRDAIEFGDSFDNMVFMGMGEPLHNYDGVVRALRVLTDQYGLGIGARRITVSTVGLVPAIDRFAKEDVKVNIAVSLNATTDEVRSQIMPINRRFPIARLLESLRQFPLPHRRSFTIEYVLLSGVNDSDEDMKRLPKLLHGIPVKINLIPYNENAGLGFRSPSKNRIFACQDLLHRMGMNVTVRWSKGADIDAACGQLAVNAEKKKHHLAVLEGE